MKLIKKRWLSLVLVMTIIMTPFSHVQGATDVSVDIIKNEPTIILSDEGERIFDIGYEFDVEFEALTTGLDLVLVLDRSNSMLRTDPSTDLPVADAVWAAVNEFITEYYRAYPASNVAVVSFGTNGNKSDNWKYFNALEGTLDEIEDVYEYRDLYNNYHSNFRSYWNNGYRYAWENWQISDGATNIAAAFEYAATTVDHKQVVVEENGQDVILLFTDGVATQGGSKSQKNYNYPTAHNTNTIAAYEAGIEAQEVAEVITVGYFEGLEYESTKAVARDTLELSQNAGFFEADQTGALTDIFETVVEELNYVGSDAVVTETVEDEFEVVVDSIQPAASSVTVDSQGRTVITWDLGNVIDDTYSFGYQVKVKDDVYPTGSGSLKIPINLNAELSYTDLNGNGVVESLGQNETTIPPRSNQPSLSVLVEYVDGYGYLVGDEITLNHEMAFVNEVPFDYREILVRDLIKSVSGGSFGLDLLVSDASYNQGWSIDEGTLIYDIQETESTSGDLNLEWDKDVALSLMAMSEGSYDLGYSVEYQLTNSADLEFEFSSVASDPGTIQVRQGKVYLELSDTDGEPITDVRVMVDGTEMATVVEGNQVLVSGVTSGSHNISFEVPSGYEYLSADAGVVLVDDDVAFTETLDYDHWEVTKAVLFKRLNVKEASITDRDGHDLVDVEEVATSVEALVTFTLTVPLTKVGLRIVDDYEGADHDFVLDSHSGYGHVEDSYGNQINGFTMVDGVLLYDGPTLSADTFMAYGVISSPDTFGESYDYDYEVYVDQIITREDITDSEVVDVMTSDELGIQLIDNDAPLIVPTLNEALTTTNSANYDIRVTDKVQIVDLVVYKGEVALEAIDDTLEIVPYTYLDEGDIAPSLWNYTEDINCYDELVLEVIDNKLLSTGVITVYARDAFGNEGVKVIEIDLEAVNELLDGAIK